MKVLITTSGIGSRLGNLTKFTNKALVRVGRRPAISYIIDEYPKDAEFVVTLGHYGDHVRQYLAIAHPDRNIRYAEVDVYEGEGSSLLRSIRCAKDALGGQPFIFHACDTIVRYGSVPSVGCNWLGGHPSRGSSHYRTFNASGGRVTRLNEKGEKTSDFDYIGICGISDVGRFWSLTDRILSDGGCPSDYDPIVSMLSEGCAFESRTFGGWNDIGNIDSLKAARQSVEDSFDLLDKDDESIFMLDGKVIKFFHNKSICSNRVERARLLGDKVPRILASSDNFYAYEYTDGEILSKTITPKQIKSLLEWASESLWIPVLDDGSYTRRCEEFYRTKTLERVAKFCKSNGLEDKAEVINGESVPPVTEMLQRIDFSAIAAWSPRMFHGDFILENILGTKDGFVLLDWRQDFGGSVRFGDFHYDLAKLNHNLTLDHSSVHRNLYSSVQARDGVRCQIMVPSINMDCKAVLRNYCQDQGIDYGKIELLTAIVWLNMSPLHEHPLDKFLYHFGKYHLYRSLKELGWLTI